MKQANKADRGRAMALSAIALIVACGGTKSLGRDASDNGQPGAGNQPIAGTAPTPADGQLAGGKASSPPTGGSGGASVRPGSGGADLEAVGGQSAAGQTGVTTPGYDFYVLPDITAEGPDRTGLIQGDALIDLSTDGMLLTGTSWWQAFNPLAQQFEHDSVPFVWTPSAGMQLFSGLSSAVNLVPCGAGAAVFGIAVDGGHPKLFRFVPGVGSTFFDIPFPNVSDSPPAVLSCSADGNAAIIVTSPVAGTNVTLLWRHGENNDLPLELQLPARYFSDDGSAVFAQVTGADHRVRNYRAPVVPGPLMFEELKPPAGYSDCWYGSPPVISRDGSVVVGTCGWPQNLPVMFRWQVGDAAMTIVKDGPASPQIINHDGSIVIGAGVGGDRASAPDFLSGLTWWTADGTVRFPDVEAGHVHGLSDDSSHAWARMNLDGEFSVPFRLSHTGGISRLPQTDGELGSYIQAISPDGTLAVGNSEFFVPERASNGRRIVLWDAYGVRNITQELTDAGVDLGGTITQMLDANLEPSFVFSGSSVRIIGCYTSSNPGRTWIATVPSR